MTSIVDLNNRYTNLLRHYPMIIKSSDPDLLPRELSINHPVVEDLKFVKTFRPFYKYYAKKGFIKQGVIERLGLRDLRDPMKIHFYRSTLLNIDDNNEHSVSIPDVVTILKMIIPSRNEDWKIFPTLLREIVACKNARLDRIESCGHTTSTNADDIIMSFLDHVNPERNEFCYVNDIGKLFDVWKYHYEETDCEQTFDVILRNIPNVVLPAYPFMEPWRYTGYPVDINDLVSDRPDFSNTIYTTFVADDDITTSVDKNQEIRSGGTMSDDFYETLLVAAGCHRYFKFIVEEATVTQHEILAENFTIVESRTIRVPPFSYAHGDLTLFPIEVDVSCVATNLLAQCAIILRNIGVADNTEFPMMSVSLCITLEEDVLVKIETDTINVVWHYDLKLYKLIPPVLEHGTLSFD